MKPAAAAVWTYPETEPTPVEPGRIPRISRLMAVAIRLERLLLTGEVSDLTELARLGHVTQPRMSQILNLTLLAPDIQEELLFLPRVTSGKATIHEKMLRPIAAESDWGNSGHCGHHSGVTSACELGSLPN